MSNDEADIRRARLMALRDGAEPLSEPPADTQVPESRSRIRKLLAERRRGAGDGLSMDSGRPMRAARLRGGAGGSAAAGLERFPRLAQLLAERNDEITGGGEVTASHSPEEIAHYREGLESLMAWLEQTLDSTRDQLAEVRRWESDTSGAGTPGASGGGSGANG